MINEEKRNGIRYVLMISRYYYATQQKKVHTFIYSDDLLGLFRKHDELWKQDQEIINSDIHAYSFEYEFFDYQCCHYIKRHEFICFVDNEPITCVVRWGRNGRKYVFENITESKMKSLIKKYGVEQICDHTLWLYQ